MKTTVFFIQYARKGVGFDGWYNLRAFTTLETAEKALKEEQEMDAKRLDSSVMYCINSLPIES